MSLIPNQVYVPYIGAIYELLTRVAFLYSMVSQIQITRLFYYNSNDPFYKNTFSSYWIYIGFLLLVCWFLSWISWTFLIPSQNRFQQEQAVIEGRSPLYEKVCEIEKMIMELKK
jgi:hypothetical protein